MGVKERIKRIEDAIKDKAKDDYPRNEDGFITALGVNEKDFEMPGGGYNAIAALGSTAADDWA